LTVATSATRTRSPRLAYSPGLDGIRALSILGIMANHLGLAWANGGFISVNVFFVLSGYLISSLLLKEWQASGTIRLRTFWARRARRLLPALFLLLVGIALYSWLLAPLDTRATLRSDALATLLYVANWHQIIAGQSYFAQAGPLSPLLHTWTLAIEEQFYLLWPLIVLGLFKWRRSPRLLAVVSLIAAVGSAVEMGLLFHGGAAADPSRLYYGTDTRAQDLLVGATLAFVLGNRQPVQRTSRWSVPGVVGVLGLAGFALEWSRLNFQSGFPYQGGFFLADALTAAVILGVVLAPASILARVLGTRPLVYIGKISYGLYLWHWPIFVVIDHARSGLSGFELLVVRVAASFAAAIFSSHFVELPIRRGAFKSWRAWVSAPAAAIACAIGLVFATVTPAGAEAITFPTSTSPSQEGGGHNLGPGPTYGYPAAYSKLTSDPGALTPVLFVGDSISLTLFFGLAKDGVADHLEIIPRGIVGCGLSVLVPLEDQGQVGDPFPECPQWPTWWKNDVAFYKPKVVCLITGYWEAMTRFYEGRWQHLGDPAYNSYVTSQLEKAISILSAGGAKVALFTSPYFENGEQPDGNLWPEANPARVNEYNEIVAQVAAQHPGVVTVVPLGAYLDPGGRFTSTIDGITVRASDGVHTTFAGDQYLAPKLLPELDRLAGVQG
jgi:peptidoglycan/LPS O-acetylase OafA/YrhL